MPKGTEVVYKSETSFTISAGRNETQFDLYIAATIMGVQVCSFQWPTHGLPSFVGNGHCLLGAQSTLAMFLLVDQPAPGSSARD